MNALTAARRVVSNLACSRGNLLVGMDGSRYLDLHTNIASLPLGYNHPNLLKLMQKQEIISLAINRPATNLYPPEQFLELLQEMFPQISPYGIDSPGYVWLGSSGAESIESAMKHCAQKSGATTFVSFAGAFHGRTLGALSLTNTNPLFNKGFPSLDVITAPFPEDYESHPEIIDRVRDVLATKDIAGVFIEPVQCEGGDRFASGAFFRAVRSLCTMYDIPFVVDEVQTNMGTGQLWAHKRWDLDTPPDIVVFGKKMQMGGFFALDHLAPRTDDEYSYMSTWAGDPFRAMMLKTILETIKTDNLYEKSSKLGNELFCRIGKISGIKNVRNINALGAFDLVEMDRDVFLSVMQENGILLGACGTHSVRVRPSLVLDEDTVDCVIDHLARIVG